MAEVKLTVNETKLAIISPKSLVATGVNYDTCNFEFGIEWEGYVKTAVFYSDSNTEPIAILLNENNTCSIPWESLSNPGILYIGVFGIKDNIEIPTNFITIKLVQGAAGHNVPPPPSLSAYKQILDKVAEVKAVENSFIQAELERKTNEEERQLTYNDFKGDITTGTGLKNELKASITTGVEVDNKLKEDISLGNALDLSLKEDITQGDALDLKLKEDIATGNTLKTGLEKDITTADTSKENLQKVIETANTTTYATKGEIQEVNAHLAEKASQLAILLSNRNTKFIGHKGLSQIVPENTLPAIEMSKQVGHWGVSIDTKTTLDGKWIIIHDNDLSSVSNNVGNVYDYTLEEIKAITITKGNNILNYPNLKIPTLEEGLVRCIEFEIVPIIEIKYYLKIEEIDNFIEIIRKLGLEEKCIVEAFNENIMNLIRERSKKIPMLWLKNSITDIDLDISKIKKWGNCGVDTGFSTLTKEQIDKFHKNEIPVGVWTINDYTWSLIMAKYGVDIITTDIIAEVN